MVSSSAEKLPVRTNMNDGSVRGGRSPLLGRDLRSGRFLSLDTSRQELPLNLWRCCSVPHSCSTMNESRREDESQPEDASARRIPNISPVADDGERSTTVSEHLTLNSCSRKPPNGSYVPQQVIREVRSDANSQLQNKDQSEDQDALDQEPMAGEQTNPPSIASDKITNEEDDSHVGGDLQDELSSSRPDAVSLDQNVPQEAVGQTVTVFGTSSRFCPTLNSEGPPSNPSKFSSIDTDSSSNNAEAINITNVSSTGVSSQKLRDRTAIQPCEGVSLVNSGGKEENLPPSAGVSHAQTGSSPSSDGRAAIMLSVEDNKPPVFGGSTSAAAASIVASFLKPSATTSSSYTPPARKKRKPDPRSPPMTPVSLAHLVSGVPTSVEGTESSGGRGHQRVSPDGVLASRRSAPGIKGSPGLLQSSAATAATCPSPRSPIGGSRFLHQEWPLRARERRRILNFPKRSEPPGTRILYWVREYFRVRDNLPLSVAMWLSTQLRIPLQASGSEGGEWSASRAHAPQPQAVTFVEPGLGGAARSRRLGNARERSGELEPRGDEEAQKDISFRMAVEASAMCEAEEALRELNIPLVALACEDRSIPEILARWCDADHGTDVQGSRRSSRTTASSPTGPMVGGVHIVVTDESYHPRQLVLAEKVGQTLRGAALYTVDSNSCSPVNAFHGGRAVTATEPATKTEFREAQETALEAVCTELVQRPRLPLDVRLQAEVLERDGGARAALPGGIAAGLAGDLEGKCVEVDWDILRRLSASRFLSFPETLPTRHPRQRQSSVVQGKQDLIKDRGGGEHVAEEVLRQTLASTAALARMELKAEGPGDLPIAEANLGETGGERADFSEAERCVLREELAGAGYGGALLHLLRLGSISPLYVVQAVMQSARDLRPGRADAMPRQSKAWMRLLDQVLDREYEMYRSYFEYQRQRRGRSKSVSTCEGWWKSNDWIRLVQPSVLEALSKSPRYSGQVSHGPEEIRKAGLTVPSSVEDEVFSAVQAGLTLGARIHPALVPYWARSAIRMMLIPSQAIALVITLAEDLCLGAGVAGDLMPSILAGALGTFEETPPKFRPPPSSETSSATSSMALPDDQPPSASFAWLMDSPTSSGAHVRTVVGDSEALARFMTPVG